MSIVAYDGKSVEVACRFSVVCGCGVEVYEL